MAESKKGLQIGKIADCAMLGVKHCAWNVPLNTYLIQVGEGGLAEGDVEVAPGIALAGKRLSHLDHIVHTLTTAGSKVYFILLAADTGITEIDELLLNPKCNGGQHKSCRVADEAGAKFLRDIITVLANRYSPSSAVGYVHGWVVGNEVDAHHVWHNLGPVTLEEVVEAYELAVRLVYEVVSAVSPEAHIFVSFTHHWTAMVFDDPKKCCKGRDLLNGFAELVKKRGDFPWHVNYHAYPQNIWKCKFWNDDKATDSPDTKYITMRNIQILCDHMRRDEMLYEGKPRRIVLGEQGFHVTNADTGEHDQACAFALAWTEVQEHDLIDAFIYHRHVDNASKASGGLKLGLYENVPGTITDIGRPRAIQELFLACDTPDGPAKLEPYLTHVRNHVEQCAAEAEELLSGPPVTQYTLHKQTIVKETNPSTWLRLLNDRRMVTIQTKSAGGKVEVHVTDASNDGWSVHAATPIPETAPICQWDVDKESGDVYFFKIAKDSKMEVHVLDAAARYKDYKLHAETAWPVGAFPDSFSVFVGPSQDIYIVKMNHTTSKKTEVHILTKSSKYKQFRIQTPSILDMTNPSEGHFQVDQETGALVFFKRLNHLPGKPIEMHILRPPKYEVQGFQGMTCLRNFDDNIQFDIHKEAFCVFQKDHTDSGFTEMHMFVISGHIEDAAPCCCQ